MPDSVISRPLLGRNLGLDELLQCAVQARDLQRKPPQVTAHAVKTRAITAKEAKEEQQAVMIREAEQAVIIKPEELQPAVLEPVVDATQLDKNGEPLAVPNDSVDPSVNIGIVIPVMETGASLGEEYKGAILGDETLKEWKGYGTSRSKGFLWDNGGS